MRRALSKNASFFSSLLITNRHCSITSDSPPPIEDILKILGENEKINQRLLKQKTLLTGQTKALENQIITQKKQNHQTVVILLMSLKAYYKKIEYSESINVEPYAFNEAAVKLDEITDPDKLNDSRRTLLNNMNNLLELFEKIQRDNPTNITARDANIIAKQIKKNVGWYDPKIPEQHVYNKTP